MSRAGIAASAAVSAYAAQLAHYAFDDLASLLSGAAAVVVFFAVRFPAVVRVGRIFLLLIPVLAALVLIHEPAPVATLRRATQGGLLLFTFISALSSLRIAAGSSALLERCGRHLVAQPPGRSYVTLNVGSTLAATVLLFGVINLFGAMLVSASSDASQLRRHMLAVLRGFALMPVWSPIALPFGLLSSYYGDVHWSAILPFSACVIVAVTLVGVLADRIEYPRHTGAEPPVRADDAGPDLLRLVLLVGALTFCVGAAAWATGWGVVRADIAFVPLFAVGWLAVVLAGGGAAATARSVVSRLGKGLAGEGSAVAVMTGAGFCGIALGALAPVETMEAALRSLALPHWAWPALIVALFTGLGQVGFSPTLTFIMLAIMVPDPALLGLQPAIFHAIILGIWGLASIGTPFSVPALATSHIFGVSPTDVAWRWSPLFAIAAPLSVAAVFTVAAVLAGAPGP